jgi:hypothetical protein
MSNESAYQARRSSEELLTENDSRKETSFGHAQEDSGDQQAMEILHQAHQSHLQVCQHCLQHCYRRTCTDNDTPSYHNGRQPDRRPQLLQQHVTWHLESAICKEES